MTTGTLNKRSLYWICQIGGWLFFVVLNSIFLQLNNNFNEKIAAGYFLLFVFGVGYSHLYRELIIRADWLRMNKFLLVPLVLISTLVLSALVQITQISFEFLLNIKRVDFSNLNYVALSVNIINLAFVFFFWSLIYFLVHYFENYRKAEIENLKWEASINEIELNKLKSQLNPHFIFNSMNSIRALVDEDPDKAKKAITQLSNILRTTLLMGKKKVVSFEEELNIVKDYLDLETTRFEERLKVVYDIQPGSEKFEIPPLMLQTLVENGIKHGISKLQDGGQLILRSRIVDRKLILSIENTGKLNGHSTGTGFGIKNTNQRLSLLYGNEGSFTIRENPESNTVTSTIVIPDKKVI